MTEHRDVAIVTGGNTGIGAAIARSLLDDGYEVLSLSRRKPDWSHARLHGFEVDLYDAKATQEIAQDIARLYPVSHIVHNAGAIRAKLLPDVSMEDFAALTQLHLGAATLLLQAALPGMKERKFGRVVMMSSRALLGLQTRTAYSATKAGMVGMSRTWALELAPFGVTVNVVAPGPIEDTEMFESVTARGSERANNIARAIPVGRLGLSADVARAVQFFAAREAGFVTGQLLYVCGGASLGSITI